MSLAVAPAPAPAPVPAAQAPAPTPAPGAASTPSPSTIYFSPLTPSTGVGQLDSSGNYGGPALRALPVDAADGGPDASLHRRFYTLSASLRETYDGNVSTSNNNQQSSLDTELSPSILVNFPAPDGTFSGRYTLGLTYYTSAPDFNGNGSTSNSGTNNNNNNNGSSLQVSHDFLASYSHSFSDRFQMSLGEELRYFTEPSIMESVGTNYQSGPYISNVLNGTLSGQWSPLFSTVATVGNTVVHYDDSAVGQAQDSVEDNASFTGSYAFFPKIALSAGVVFDNSTYQSGDRGYSSYTFFGGGSWQALPSLSFTGRGGASYTETVGDAQGSIAPYAALSANWTLGARSALNFSYSHEITPSAQTDANGQESDRFSAGFNYQITTRLGAFLDGIFTISTVSDGLSINSAGNNYTENVYAIDTGLNYQYNTYLGFDGGITLSGVDSNIDNNNYTRDEVYLGIRGTY